MRWDLRSDEVGPNPCYGASEDGLLWVCSAGKDAFGVRDAETGGWIRRFKQKTSVAAISPDGSLVAAYDDRRKPAVLLWDVATGDRKAVLEGCGEKVGRLAFGPDGKLLAGTCVSESFRDYGTAVWDAASGARVQTLSHSALFRGPVAFSGDGRWAALADNVQAVVYDASSWSKVRSVGCMGELVHSVALSDDGGYLAAATAKGLCVSEAGSGRRVLELPGGGLEAVAFGRQTERNKLGALAVVDSKGGAVLWESRSLQDVLLEVSRMFREAAPTRPGEVPTRRARWLAEHKDRGYPFRVRAELGDYDAERGGLVVRFTSIPAAPQQTTHEALVPMPEDKARQLASKWGEAYVQGSVYYRDAERAELADAYLTDGLSSEVFPFGRKTSTH